MGHLVDHRDADLMHDLRLIGTHLTDRKPKDGDPVRQHEVPVSRSPLCQRDSLVQPEETPAHVAVSDCDRHVVHHAGQFIGDGVEGFNNKFFETVRPDVHAPHGTHPWTRGRTGVGTRR